MITMFDYIVSLHEGHGILVANVFNSFVFFTISLNLFLCLAL